MAYEQLDPSKKETRVFRFLESCDSTIRVSLHVVSLDDWTDGFLKHRPQSFVSLRQILPVMGGLDRDPCQLHVPELNIMSRTETWIRNSFDKSYSHIQPHSASFPRWRYASDILPSCEVSSATRMNTSSTRQQRLFSVPHRFRWGDYEAISYCWAGEEKDGLIVVDNTPVKVPQNLVAALIHLRALPEARDMCFWADALCIQQANLGEKNQQVGMMRLIFISALSVVVWLGPSDSEHTNTADAISASYASSQAVFAEDQRSGASRKTLVDQESGDVEVYIPKQNFTSVQTPLQFSEFPTVIEPKLWADILSFFSRPYWTRLWVLQEMALNQSMTLFVSGPRLLTRDMLQIVAKQGLLDPFAITESISTLKRDSAVEEEFLFEAFERVQSVLRLSGIPHRDNHMASDLWYLPQGLTQVLDLAQKSKCLDPKDKIYGLAGLLYEHMGLPIFPRYDLSLDEIYTDFAKSLLLGCGIESLLAWCSGHRIITRASWVPDWAARFPRHHVRWLRSRSACGPRHHETEVQGHELRSYGILVDRVAQTARETKSATHQPSDLHSRSSTRYGTHSHIIHTLSHVLVQDHPSKQALPSRDPDLVRQEGDRFLSNIPWPSVNIASGSSSISDLPANHPLKYQKTFWVAFEHFRETHANFDVLGYPFWSFFPDTDYVSGVASLTNVELTNMRISSLAVRGRRLATSEKGWLGMVPEEARKDDFIAVIYGCGFPVVLRPHRDNFAYIGECYIHGLMDGEAIDLLQQGELEERDIVII